MAEAKISPVQMQKVHAMREEIWKIDQELRQERVSLDLSIKEFYLHKMRVIPNYPAIQTPDNPAELQDPSKLIVPTPPETPVEVSDAIELSRKLNALKKNFCNQRNLMINAFSRTAQLLSPKQQALLLLKLQIQTRFNSGNMDLLKNVWESVTSSEAPVSTLLSMLPDKDGNIAPNTTLPSTTTFGAVPMIHHSPPPPPHHSHHMSHHSLSPSLSIPNSNGSPLSPSLSGFNNGNSSAHHVASVRSATGLIPSASGSGSHFSPNLPYSSPLAPSISQHMGSPQLGGNSPPLMNNMKPTTFHNFSPQ